MVLINNKSKFTLIFLTLNDTRQVTEVCSLSNSEIITTDEMLPREQCQCERCEECIHQVLECAAAEF